VHADEFQIQHYADVTRAWNRTMQSFARAHPSETAFVSITDKVCATDETLCDDTFHGELARPDGTHYEGAAQRWVSRMLIRRFARILGSRPRAGTTE
jgi:hypothetical protein